MDMDADYIMLHMMVHVMEPFLTHPTPSTSIHTHPMIAYCPSPPLVTQPHSPC